MNKLKIKIYYLLFVIAIFACLFKYIIISQYKTTRKALLNANLYAKKEADCRRAAEELLDIIKNAQRLEESLSSNPVENEHFIDIEDREIRDIMKKMNAQTYSEAITLREAEMKDADQYARDRTRILESELWSRYSIMKAVRHFLAISSE